ncbi:hypothetical protein ABZ848_02395 [Streptomyces sp. NPDC047081]|uniref:hypothetical protein n=1 Tax=Streptomyces sp. NPDC047081 TaxID=3154706 RepID=UPI0033E48AD8
MAAELGALADALTRAMEVPAAARQVKEVLTRLKGDLSSKPRWIWRPTQHTRTVDWLGALEALQRQHPDQLAELQAIAAEYGPSPSPAPAAGTTNTVTASGDRSVAAGGGIGAAITGDGATVKYVAGDHLDFGGGNFPGGVVGKQHNEVQNNYYGTVPAPIEWRPVGEVTPREFGVAPTRHVHGLPDVPPYVPRDCDEELHALLDRGGLVLVLGESHTGKSYTAWNGARALSDGRVSIPDSAEVLRRLPASLPADSGCHVVWLDELTDHLGKDGLEPRLLRRLTSAGVVLLGTMSTDEYYRMRVRSTPASRLVAMASTVEVPRAWSDEELRRLRDTDDPRAHAAYMWSGGEGPAAYFAVGHLLFDEWRRPGTTHDHPHGQLLVQAAVDLVRCGVRDAVPVGLLTEVEEFYPAGPRTQESFENALAWATARLFRASGLLVEGEERGSYRAYGALVAEALASGELPPVPDEVWWTLLGVHESWGIDRAAVLDAARNALRSRVESGDTGVMRRFAEYTDGEERKDWYRRAADLGDGEAAFRLAKVLIAETEDGDEQAAVPYLEAAADRGNGDAAYLLGRFHLSRAKHWMLRSAEAPRTVDAAADAEAERAWSSGESSFIVKSGGVPLRIKLALNLPLRDQPEFRDLAGDPDSDPPDTVKE